MFTVVLAAGSARAQGFAVRDIGARLQRQNGFEVNSASAYLGAFWLTPPSNDSSGFGVIPGAGWRTNVSWNALRSDHTGVSINYDLSFDGSWKRSELNSINHFLMVSYQAKIKPRLLLSAAANAQSSTVTEYLFRTPASLGLMQDASDIQDLANGISGEAFSGAQPSVIGQSVADSPLLAFLSNSRIYSSSGGMTLTYWKSRRLSYHSGLRAASSKPAGGTHDSLASPGLLSAYTNAGANAGLAYLLSRRLEFGMDVDYSRSYAAGIGIETVSTLMNLTHPIRERWIVRLGGGFGTVAQSRAAAIPRYFGYEAAGTGGYKGAAHTVIVFGYRSVGDIYGRGATNTVSTGLAWTWHPRGSKWELAGRGAYERVGGGISPQIEGWVVYAGATRNITRHMSWMAEYVHAREAADSSIGFNSLVRRGSRLSLVWHPRSMTVR